MADEKTNLKVLELIDTYYPTVDGAINVVANYAKNLNDTIDCRVAAPRPAKKSGYTESDDFPVLRCKSGWAPSGYRNANPYFDKKFRDEVKKGGYDILHAHSPFAIGRCAVSLAKEMGIPVVMTLHTKYKQDFERELHGFKPLVNFMVRHIVRSYNKADYVWTVSETSKQVLREYGYKGKIDVVRNGTEYTYPENAEELIESVNAKHNLYGQKNVFVFVGRMAIYKNLPLLCDALKILKESGKTFKFIFVGGGFDIEKIEKLVEKLGLCEECIFTGEIKNRELIQAYYLRSDLLVFPSTFDMASVVKVEAAAHKKAAVVIEKSCTAEQIIDGVNGFLCKETAESLAEKLIELADDEERMKSVGENAYKTIYRSWADVSAEVLEKYREIVEEYKNKNSGKQR